MAKCVSIEVVSCRKTTLVSHLTAWDVYYAEKASWACSCITDCAKLKCETKPSQMIDVTNRCQMNQSAAPCRENRRRWQQEWSRERTGKASCSAEKLRRPRMSLSMACQAPPRRVELQSELCLHTHYLNATRPPRHNVAHPEQNVLKVS